MEKENTNKNVKKYMVTVEEVEGDIKVGFDSFEEQDPMSSVDASLVILALTQIMMESGLNPKDLKGFLDNIGEAAIDYWKTLNEKEKEETDENSENNG